MKGARRMPMINNFDIFKEMGNENKDIRLAPLSNIEGIDKKGKKCTVTIGIDEDTFNDLLAKKNFIGGLILADGLQFYDKKEEILRREKYSQ